MPQLGELTEKQVRAVEALLTARTITAAANVADVDRRTLQRWMVKPEFRAALMDAEGQVIDQAQRRLIQLADQATDALADVMSDPDQPGAGVKLRAATATLDQLTRLREVTTTEQRLSELERKVRT